MENSKFIPPHKHNNNLRYISVFFRGVVTHEIKHLKPDKKYIVQVVIKSKKPGSKTLSYDLLQVETKPTCEPL